MSRVILTIDCDFVFKDLLDTLNDKVFTNTKSMMDFRDWLVETGRFETYGKMFVPDIIRVRFVNSIIQKHARRGKGFVCIKNHEEVLKHIDKENDIVFNIDYHEDMDMDEEELFCGNWANQVKNYQWVEHAEKEFFDMDYDLVVVCFSPEWTPDVKWLDNLILKKELEALQKM